MKNIIRICSIFIVIICFFYAFTIVNASAGWDVAIQNQTILDNGKIISAMSKTIGVVQTVGIVVAILTLLVMSIKYILSAPNDKAEIKKHFVTYAIGAIILFSVIGVLEVIKIIVKDVF